MRYPPQRIPTMNWKMTSHTQSASSSKMASDIAAIQSSSVHQHAKAAHERDEACGERAIQPGVHDAIDLGDLLPRIRRIGERLPELGLVDEDGDWHHDQWDHRADRGDPRQQALALGSALAR
jgi:hypothetical protein